MEAFEPFTRRPLWSLTAVDLQNLEMTLTLEEWHRQRDRDDDTEIVVRHEPDLLLAS